MKISRLLPSCGLVLLLSGCAAFKSPSSTQSRRNEDSARAAEGQRADYDRSRAIDSRAATYEKQGLSESDARAAANAETTAPRPPR